MLQNLQWDKEKFLNGYGINNNIAVATRGFRLTVSSAPVVTYMGVEISGIEITRDQALLERAAGEM